MDTKGFYGTDSPNNVGKPEQISHFYILQNKKKELKLSMIKDIVWIQPFQPAAIQILFPSPGGGIQSVFHSRSRPSITTFYWLSAE